MPYQEPYTTQNKKIDKLLNDSYKRIKKRNKELLDFLILFDWDDFDIYKNDKKLMRVVKHININKYYEEIIDDCKKAYELNSIGFKEKIWCEDGLTIEERLLRIRTQFIIQFVRCLTQNEDFKKAVNYLIFRLETLLKTEVAHYYREGIIDNSSETKYRYITAQDEYVCPECKKFDNRIVDKKWVDRHNWHPNCRCFLIPVKGDK